MKFIFIMDLEYMLVKLGNVKGRDGAYLWGIRYCMITSQASSELPMDRNINKVDGTELELELMEVHGVILFVG